MTTEPLFTLELTKAELAAVFASVGMAADTAMKIPPGHKFYESAQGEMDCFTSIMAKTLNAKDQHPEAFDQEPTVVVLS